MNKKVIIVVFVLVSVLVAHAQSTKDYSVALTDDNAGVIITAYNGNAAMVGIPSKLEGLDVKGIGSGAFRNKTTITKVTFPKGITEIGDGAFQGCRNLAAVTLPDTLQKIGARAFDTTGLANISIPKGCTSIGEGAFSNCTQLKTVTLPADLASIPANMFSNCEAIVQITMPGTVKSIGSKAFAGCIALTTFNVPQSVELINFAGDVFEGCSKINLGTQAALKKIGYNGKF